MKDGKNQQEPTDSTPDPIPAASPHCTPGPWRLVRAEYPDAGGYVEPRVFSYADPDNPKIICSMAVRDGETEEANGLMVAAAPEMYEALKPFAELSKTATELRHEPHSTCTWRIKKSDLDAARAALEKVQA